MQDNHVHIHRLQTQNGTCGSEMKRRGTRNIINALFNSFDHLFCDPWFLRKCVADDGFRSGICTGVATRDQKSPVPVFVLAVAAKHSRRRPVTNVQIRAQFLVLVPELWQVSESEPAPLKSLVSEGALVLILWCSRCVVSSH